MRAIAQFAFRLLDGQSAVTWARGRLLHLLCRDRTDQGTVQPEVIGYAIRHFGDREMFFATDVINTGIAGICLATLVLMAVDHVSYDPVMGSANFQLRFSHAMTIMVVFLILGTGAGLIPAIKAMRIKPIEAMRDK